MHGSRRDAEETSQGRLGRHRRSLSPPSLPGGGEGRALRVAYPIANQNRCASCHGKPSERPFNGVLLIDLQPLPADTGLHSHGALLALGLAALTLFGGMMAWTLRRQINQPLQQLTAVADRIAAGDTGARAAMPGRDEFARLGHHFDEMAERIDATVGSLRAQQSFLQQLVDAIPDPVLVVGPDYRIRIANAAYGQLTGQAHADIVQACCHRVGRGLDEPCPSTLVTCPVAELRRSRHTLRTVMSLPQRQRPSLRHLKDLAATGTLGRVESIDIRMIRRAGTRRSLAA